MKKLVAKERSLFLGKSYFLFVKRAICRNILQDEALQSVFVQTDKKIWQTSLAHRTRDHLCDHVVVSGTVM